MVKTIAVIALGGATGSVLRYVFNMGVQALTRSDFPYGIVTINILGSFIMGALAALFSSVWAVPDSLRLFLTVGIMGGFTTFSAFSLDTMILWTRGDMAGAMFYMTGSVIFSIAAVFFGSFLVMRFVV